MITPQVQQNSEDIAQIKTQLSELIELVKDGSLEKQSQRAEPKPQTDWSQMSKAKLFGEGEDAKPPKGIGAADERILRAYRAIVAHNDQFPPEELPEKKWQIGNRSLHELSGVSPNVVGDWLKRHESMVANHLEKHNINDIYHNRKYHRGESISDLLYSTIEDVRED